MRFHSLSAVVFLLLLHGLSCGDKGDDIEQENSVRSLHSQKSEDERSVPTNASEACTLSASTYLSQYEKLNVEQASKETNTSKYEVITYVGIGADDPKGKDAIFDATLISTIPKSFDVPFSESGTFETKTIYGDPFEISFSRSMGDKAHEVLWVLEDIPSMDFSGTGSCCEASYCDVSCGNACGVAFCYRVLSATPLANLGSFFCHSEPSCLRSPNDTKFLDVIMEWQDLDIVSPSLTFRVPSRCWNTPIKVISCPEGLSVRKESKSTRFTKENLAVSGGLGISVSLQEFPPGRRVLPGFAKITGKRKKPLLPEVKWKERPDCKFTRSTSVEFVFPLVIDSASAYA